MEALGDRRHRRHLRPLVKARAATLSPETIQRLAQRVANLNPRNDEETGLVSVVTAALYALREVSKRGYSASGKRFAGRRQVLEAAGALADGRDPNPPFLGGYYFNDAMFRLDVGYENALRYLTGVKDTGIEPVIEAANEKGCVTPLGPWLEIRRDEVNALKHRNPEQVKRTRAERSVRPAVALQAAKNLISLVEGLMPSAKSGRT